MYEICDNIEILKRTGMIYETVKHRDFQCMTDFLYLEMPYYLLN